MANKDPFKSAYSEQIAALVQKAQDNTANFKYDPMTMRHIRHLLKSMQD